MGQQVLAAHPPQPHLYLCHLQITLYTSFRGGWKCQWLGTFLRNGFQPQVGTEFPQHINVCYMKRRHCKEPDISSCPKGWLSPGGNLHPGYRSSGICLPCGILQIPSLGTTLCECHTEPRLWIQQSFWGAPKIFERPDFKANCYSHVQSTKAGTRSAGKGRTWNSREKKWITRSLHNAPCCTKNTWNDKVRTPKLCKYQNISQSYLLCTSRKIISFFFFLLGT